MLMKVGSIICPFDRHSDTNSIRELKTNYTVLQICQNKPGERPENVLCSKHALQIALICKTCDELACPKCIRQHKFHDLYDLDHPEIIQSLQTDLKEVERDFDSFTTMAHLSKLRLEKELLELNANADLQIKRIESYFNDIYYVLDKCKKECIALFEKKVDEIRKLLNAKKSGLLEAESYCEKYIEDINDIRTFIDESKCQDKALANLKRLKDLHFGKYQSLSDINSLPLRLSVQFPPIPSDIFTNLITITERTPISRLIEMYRKEKDDLMMRLEMRISSVPEQLLALNVYSTTSFLFLYARDTNTAFSHLLERCTIEHFGVGTKALPESTQSELFNELQVEPYDEAYVRSLLPNLRRKIRSFEFVRFSMSKLMEGSFELSLKVLYNAIKKESDPELSIHIAKIALIVLCAKAYKLGSEQKVMETLPYLELATEYLKAIFNSSELIYRQVEAYIRSIYTNIETNLPEVFYPFFQRKCSTFLKDIEVESMNLLPFEVPDELQETLDQIEKYELLFWRGEKRVNSFFEDVKRIRDKFKHVFKGISILYNRRTLLNTMELCRINLNI
jgi:uncharacterized protein YfkK (UPF0435 family)